MHASVRPSLTRLGTALFLAACSVIADAAPRIPQDDGEVLERLPLVVLGAQAELRELRDALARDPANLDLATRLARRYVEIGREAFDPRYFGYAEATLKPWWTLTPPLPQVLLFRGILRQQRHDFDGALADLSVLLRQDPRNAQALLLRAGIFQVRGDHSQAKRDCAALLYRPIYRLPATACYCKSLSLTGQASQGYEALREVIESSPEAPSAERRWALTLLAEMAQRMGKPNAADQHFREALAIGPHDSYLLMSYSEFLLDRGRPREVLDLLADRTRADGLLLRLALAEQQLDLDAEAHKAVLEERFDASRMRGERAHQGEEARLRLYLMREARQALQLAIENWETQREPRDARILLEAALAAHDAEAANPVLLWIDRSRLEDVQLARLAVELRAARR